jgi:hypothetical protein
MNPYQGMLCLWHPHATQNSEPVVSIVTKVHGNGRVDLLTWPHSGGESVRKKNLRHVSDPIFDTSPKLADREGGWKEIVLPK